MKGIILNLVEDAVVAEHGEAAWDSLLATADLEGAYTSLGNYPDDELGRLVEAGARIFDTDVTDLTRHLGQASMSGLAQRYPHYFAPFDSTRPFVLTVNEVIHPEVRKLHPDSDPPDFWFDDGDPDVLVVHYFSRRRLCRFAEGMLHGAAGHFGEMVELEHVQCLLEGADHCTIRARFREMS